MFAINQTNLSKASAPPQLTKTQIVCIAYSAFYAAMGATPSTLFFREGLRIVAEKIKNKVVEHSIKRAAKDLGVEIRENGDIVIPKGARIKISEAFKASIPQETITSLRDAMDDIQAILPQ